MPLLGICFHDNTVTAPSPIGVWFVAVAPIVSISKEYGPLRSLTMKYFGSRILVCDIRVRVLPY